MDDAPALMRLEIDTTWQRDTAGLLVRSRTAEWRSVPLLTVGCASPPSAGTLVWATSAAVREEVAALIADALAAEADATGPAGVGWAPRAAERLLAVLEALGPLATSARGPAYVVPPGLAPPPGVDLVRGGAGDEARFRDLMPERDRTTLLAPWTAALVDGRVAAVCETARSAPSSVEAGVWTYEPHRRQGLASAVTAAWSHQVAGRTAFYSTGDANLASQGVARRLGLRPLAQWWSVHRADDGAPARP
jgi:hypothetical protein